MTINASHIRTEIINTVTEILQSLQYYPENNINILKPLLHALRITRRAIASPGKELPRTELQWCEKLQTLAPLEASTPSENHSTTDAATRDNTQDASIANDFSAADATTQDAPSTTDTQGDASATQDATTQDNPSTADTTTQDAPSTTDTQGDASATQDATTQDNPSTADTTTQDAPSTTDTQGDASATQDATTQDNPSTTDTTTQDAPSTTDTQGDASTTQDTSIAEKNQIIYKKMAESSVDDELIKKFLEKAEKYKSWTDKPHLFWKPPTLQELQLPEPTLNQRLKSFHEGAAETKPKVEALGLIHRFESVIAYFRFRQRYPLDNIRLSNVEKYLEQIGIPIESAPKHQTVLLSGRRRVQFCLFLSKDNINFENFSSFILDDINFDDIDYGGLFLELDDRIWESVQTKFYKVMMEIIKELKLRKITQISERSGAKLGATTVLKFRQALIELPAPSDKEGNNSTVVPERASTEDDSDSTRASEYAEDDSDSTRASECAEDDSDSTRASDCTSIEDNLNGKRAIKRTHTEADMRAPKRACTEGHFKTLLQAAAFTHQNTTPSDGTIANLDSSLHNMQLNHALSPNSQRYLMGLSGIKFPLADGEVFCFSDKHVNTSDVPSPSTNIHQFGELPAFNTQLPNTNTPQFGTMDSLPNTNAPQFGGLPAFNTNNTPHFSLGFNNGQLHTSNAPLPNTNTPQFGTMDALPNTNAPQFGGLPAFNTNTPHFSLGFNNGQLHTSNAPLSNTNTPHFSNGELHTSNAPLSNTNTPHFSLGFNNGQLHTSNAPLSNTNTPHFSLGFNNGQLHTSNASLPNTPQFSNRELHTSNAPLSNTNTPQSNIYFGDGELNTLKILPERTLYVGNL